jgi:hypothetical protein
MPPRRRAVQAREESKRTARGARSPLSRVRQDNVTRSCRVAGRSVVRSRVVEHRTPTVGEGLGRCGPPWLVSPFAKPSIGVRGALSVRPLRYH